MEPREYIPSGVDPLNSMAETVVLVTGGTGLVGRAVEWVVTHEKFKPAGVERWIFVGSKDADLTDSQVSCQTG